MTLPSSTGSATAAPAVTGAIVEASRVTRVFTMRAFDELPHRQLRREPVAFNILAKVHIRICSGCGDLRAISEDQFHDLSALVEREPYWPPEVGG